MRKWSKKFGVFVYMAEHMLAVVAICAIATLSFLLSVPQESVRRVAERVSTLEPILRIERVSGEGVALSWSIPEPVSAIAEYRLFRNGTLFARSHANIFTDPTFFPPGTRVEYVVAAVDAAGNSSFLSEPAVAVIPDGADTPPSISFSVTPAPVNDCTSGTLYREVFLGISEPSGGYFLLRSLRDISAKRIEWGRVILPAGDYEWQGVATPGFVPEGISAGSFAISGTCDGALSGSTSATVIPGSPFEQPSSSESTSSSSAEQAVSLLTPVSALKVFDDNVLVAEEGSRSVGTELELRVVTPFARKVEFVVAEGDKGATSTLGFGVYDDLLSFSGQEVWMFMWDTRSLHSGVYRVYARISSRDGKVEETDTVSVAIVTESASSTLRASQTSSDVATSVAVHTVIATTTVSDVELLSCLDEATCHALCEGSTVALCRASAQGVVFSPDALAPVSLADGVSADRIERLLSDHTRRPKDIPTIVHSATDLVLFCGQEEQRALCTRVLTRADLASPAMIESRAASLALRVAAVDEYLASRSGIRVFLDTDGDAIVDFDEVHVYGTDPEHKDSDGDGALDGEEVIARTNPRGDRSSDTLLSEQLIDADPRISGITRSDILEITEIERLNDATPDTPIRFAGSAPAYSFVTLFVFSDPVLRVAQTNASGTWSLLLDEALPLGTHDAIVSLVDGKGGILARSSPVSFTKDLSGLVVAHTLDTTNSARSLVPVLSLALFLASVGVGLSVFGLSLRHRKRREGYVAHLERAHHAHS